MLQGSLVVSQKHKGTLSLFSASYQDSQNPHSQLTRRFRRLQIHKTRSTCALPSKNTGLPPLNLPPPGPIPASLPPSQPPHPLLGFPRQSTVDPCAALTSTMEPTAGLRLQATFSICELKTILLNDRNPPPAIIYSPLPAWTGSSPPLSSITYSLALTTVCPWLSGRLIHKELP